MISPGDSNTKKKLLDYSFILNVHFVHVPLHGTVLSAGDPEVNEKHTEFTFLVCLSV